MNRLFAKDCTPVLATLALILSVNCSVVSAAEPNSLQTRTGALKSYTVSPAEVIRGKEYDISVISSDCERDELKGAELVAPLNSGIEVLSTNSTNPCILIARISVAQDAFLRRPMLWVNKGQLVMGTVYFTIVDARGTGPGMAAPTPAPASPTTTSTSTGFGDEVPDIELFGGYSYANEDLALFGRTSAQGWNVSLSGNFNRYFGIVGDFSGHYSTPFSVSIVGLNIDELKLRAHTALVGPRFTFRSDRATGFVHALFGVSFAQFEERVLGIKIGTSSDTAFAMAFGGGVDVTVHRNIAIRAIQVDYIPTRFEDFLQDNMQNNFRISAGVVFRFGN